MSFRGLRFWTEAEAGVFISGSGLRGDFNKDPIYQQGACSKWGQTSPNRKHNMFVLPSGNFYITLLQEKWSGASSSKHASMCRYPSFAMRVMLIRLACIYLSASLTRNCNHFLLLRNAFALLLPPQAEHLVQIRRRAHRNLRGQVTRNNAKKGIPFPFWARTIHPAQADGVHCSIGVKILKVGLMHAERVLMVLRSPL